MAYKTINPNDIRINDLRRTLSIKAPWIAPVLSDGALIIALEFIEKELGSATYSEVIGELVKKVPRIREAYIKQGGVVNERR